jgi:hypothetical protein
MANKIFAFLWPRNWLGTSIVSVSVVAVLLILFWPWSTNQNFMYALHRGAWNLRSASVIELAEFICMILVWPAFFYFVTILLIVLLKSAVVLNSDEDKSLSQIPSYLVGKDKFLRQKLLVFMIGFTLSVAVLSTYTTLSGVRFLFLTEVPNELKQLEIWKSLRPREKQIAIENRKESGFGCWTSWSVRWLKERIDEELTQFTIKGEGNNDLRRFKVLGPFLNGGKFIIAINDSSSGVSRKDHDINEIKISDFDNSFEELKTFSAKLAQDMYSDLVDENGKIGAIEPTLSNLESEYPLKDNGLDLPLQVLFLFELLECSSFGDPRGTKQSSKVDEIKRAKNIAVLQRSIRNYLKDKIKGLSEVRSASLTGGYSISYLRWFDPLLLAIWNKDAVAAFPSLSGVDAQNHTLEGSIARCFERVEKATATSKLDSDTGDNTRLDGSSAGTALYALLSLFESKVSYESSTSNQINVYDKNNGTMHSIKSSSIGAACDRLCVKMSQIFKHREVNGEDFVGGKPGFVYNEVESNDTKEVMSNGRVGTRALYHVAKAVSRLEALNILLQENLVPDESKFELIATEAVIYCDLACITIEITCDGLTDPQKNGAFEFDTFYSYCDLMRAAAVNAQVAAELQRPDIAIRCLKSINKLRNIAGALYLKDKKGKPRDYSAYFKPLGDFAAFRRVLTSRTWTKETYENQPVAIFLRKLREREGKL